MSKIEQLIDEIEEFIDGCKPVPFSSSKIAVPKDELYELLTELRLKTPDEIKIYQKIIAHKNKIIDDAKAQAEQMVQETTDYCNALVDEHEIMLKAYAKAEQTINDANAQAEEIVSAANQNADEIRVSALSYTQDMISSITGIVENSVEIARKNSEGLIGGLTENLSVLRENSDALSAQISEYNGKAAPAPAQEPEDTDEEEPEETDETVDEESEDTEEIEDDVDEDEEIVEEDDEEESEEEDSESKPKFRLFGRKDDEADEDFDDIDDDDFDGI